MRYIFGFAPYKDATIDVYSYNYGYNYSYNYTVNVTIVTVVGMRTPHHGINARISLRLYLHKQLTISSDLNVSLARNKVMSLRRDNTNW